MPRARRKVAQISKCQPAVPLSWHCNYYPTRRGKKQYCTVPCAEARRCWSLNYKPRLLHCQPASPHYDLIIAVALRAESSHHPSFAKYLKWPKKNCPPPQTPQNSTIALSCIAEIATPPMVRKSAGKLPKKFLVLRFQVSILSRFRIMWSWTGRMEFT